MAVTNSSENSLQGRESAMANRRAKERTMITSVPDVPITVEGKPFIQDDENLRAGQFILVCTSPYWFDKSNSLRFTVTARANLAISYQHPKGTTEIGWAAHHKHQTVG